jgi:NAD(P)-dependent dehydrogenase (short-subunit alcohol dehydrogenase family)
VDVTDEGAVAAAVDLAVAEFGGLDAMFNNVGIIGAVDPSPASAGRPHPGRYRPRTVIGMKCAAQVMIPASR